MDVFVGNLAFNVTYTDLIGFFKGFSNKMKLRIVDKRQDDGSKNRYAIATFISDKLALKAIKKLNGKVLRGERLVLREYFNRYYANERRALNWRDKPWNGVERRLSERRKQTIRSQPMNTPSATKPKTAEVEAKTLSNSDYTQLARKG